MSASFYRGSCVLHNCKSKLIAGAMASSFENFLVLQTAKSLRLVDMFQLQTANTQLREACIEQVLWYELLSSEFPGLDLSPALLQPACRHNIIPLLRELHQPQVFVTGRRQHVQFRSVTEVQKLVKLLSTVNRSAHTWLSNGGYSAYVVVGRMRFPSETLPMVLPKHPSALDRFPWCVGDSFPVQCTGLLDKPAANSCGAPIMPDRLFLHMAWQGSRLYLAMRNDGDVSWLVQTVFVDIVVCSSAFTLNHRNVEVAVNGTWHVCCTGLFDMTGGWAATIEALSNGVPCVVCVRRGQSTPIGRCGMSACLNLDTIRR